MKSINLTRPPYTGPNFSLVSGQSYILLLCRNTGGAVRGRSFCENLLALIPPRTDFSLVLDSAGSQISEIVFSPALLPPGLLPANANGSTLAADIPSALCQYYLSTYSLLEALPESAGPAAASAAAASLAALLSWFSLQSNPRAGEAGGPHSRLLVDRAKGIIEAEYASDLTLQSVADRLFVNPCYLSTIFHQTTDLTFRGYLKSVRLLHAKRLLAETNLLITDIAMQTGWGSTAYLISSFRQAFGITPNAYRSQQAGW